jgi:hypothetical protein
MRDTLKSLEARRQDMERTMVWCKSNDNEEDAAIIWRRIIDLRYAIDTLRLKGKEFVDAL